MGKIQNSKQLVWNIEALVFGIFLGFSVLGLGFKL